MIIGDDSDSFRLSQLAGCVQQAHIYQVSQTEAKEIIDRQIEAIEENWHDVCDQAGLQKLNAKGSGPPVSHPFALEGYSTPSASG